MSTPTIQHTRVSNGASISTYTGEHPGPRTLIVAGIHGQESGPIAALIGWHPDNVTHGSVTVIRCANTFGSDIGFRFYEVDGKMFDLGVGWDHRHDMQPLCVEFIAALRQHLGGELPNVVVDLHSSGALSQGLQVIVPQSAANPLGSSPSDVLAARARVQLIAFDGRLANRADNEPEGLDAVDGGWSVEVTDHPGGLADTAASLWGAAAITVEFASDAPLTVAAQPPWEHVGIIKGRAGLRRQRTLAEKTRGVREFVTWVTMPNRRRSFEGQRMPWGEGDGWHQ